MRLYHLRIFFGKYIACVNFFVHRRFRRNRVQYTYYKILYNILHVSTFICSTSILEFDQNSQCPRVNVEPKFMSGPMTQHARVLLWYVCAADLSVYITWSLIPSSTMHYFSLTYSTTLVLVCIKTFYETCSSGAQNNALPALTLSNAVAECGEISLRVVRALWRCVNGDRVPIEKIARRCAPHARRAEWTQLIFRME